MRVELNRLKFTVEYAIFMEKMQPVIRWYGDGCEFLMVAAKVCTMMNGMSLVNGDVVLAVEEKSREDRQFTVTSVSTHFPEMSRSRLQEIVSEKLNVRTLGSKDAYGTRTGAERRDSAQAF